MTRSAFREIFRIEREVALWGSPLRPMTIDGEFIWAEMEPEIVERERQVRLIMDHWPNSIVSELKP